MKTNVGKIDRIGRIVVALIFAYLYFSGTIAGTLGIFLLLLGIVFVFTSAGSFCPLYVPFKFSTKK